MTDPTKPVDVDSLRKIIEELEGLEIALSAIFDSQSRLFASAARLGYKVGTLRKMIELRKRKSDEIADKEAILKIYKIALGMG